MQRVRGVRKKSIKMMIPTGSKLNGIRFSHFFCGFNISTLIIKKEGGVIFPPKGEKEYVHNNETFVFLFLQKHYFILMIKIVL